MQNKCLVIIPTYNESESIQEIIDHLLKFPDVEILFVDDNSTDGTRKIIETNKGQRVHAIYRDKKLGLASAYKEAFQWGLQKQYEHYVQMDGDLSHDPSDIPKMIAHLQKVDMVIGSRYIDGVRIINWPIKRLVLSRLANIYSRIILGFSLSDSTSGFVAMRREVLQSLNLSDNLSNGYVFQIELKFKAWLKNFKLLEMPITFKDRIYGKSKFGNGIVLEAIFLVLNLKFKNIFGKI